MGKYICLLHVSFLLFFFSSFLFVFNLSKFSLWIFVFPIIIFFFAINFKKNKKNNIAIKFSFSNVITLQLLLYYFHFSFRNKRCLIYSIYYEPFRINKLNKEQTRIMNDILKKNAREHY